MNVGKVKIWQLGSILRNIYKQPGITRMELSRKLDINKSMVTLLLNRLIEDKWLPATYSGAKNVTLKLEKNRIFTAGLEIQPHHQTLVTCNLHGDIVGKQRWKNNLYRSDYSLKDTIAEYLDSVDPRVSAVGVAMPGPFDRESNRLINADALGAWDPQILPESFDNINVPVYYDNDARCCGWGLISFNREKENFLFHLSEFDENEPSTEEYMRVAIGSSIFLDQKAYTGSHSCAGEMENLSIADLESSGELSLRHSERIKIKSENAILNKMVQALGIQMGILTNYLDVSKLYIGGALEKHRPILERVLRDYKLKFSLHPNEQKTDIVYAGMDEFSVARGAAGLAFEQLFIEPALEQPHPFYEKILSSGSNN